MNKYFEHLQKIPLNFPYSEQKEALFQLFDDYVKNCGCVKAINHVIFNMVNDEMDENGMEKAVNNVVSVLYLMKYNVLDNAICYDAHCDILDIETGEYDYLFTPDDLKLFKDDILKVKKYFEKYPQLIEE